MARPARATEEEIEETEGAVTARTGGYEIVQAPRYQRGLGLFEAVAKVAGVKVVTTGTDASQAWGNLREALRKHGATGQARGEGAAAYAEYLKVA